MENQKMYQDKKEGTLFQEKGQEKLQENLWRYAGLDKTGSGK